MKEHQYCYWLKHHDPNENQQQQDEDQDNNDEEEEWNPYWNDPLEDWDQDDGGGW